MNKNIVNKIITGLVLLTAGIAPVSAQQNIQFTQYIFNSLSVNPAYAGYKEEWFAQMALRSQWEGIQDAPRTGQVSIDGILDPVNKRMGLGIAITADKLGPQASTSAYVNYAYRLRLNAEDTQRLTFGLGAGVTQYSLDFSKLTPITEGDNTVYSGSSASSFMPDMRFGVYYYNPKFYAGASMMDILSDGKSNFVIGGDTNTRESLKRRRHLYFISGLLVDLNPDVKLKPSFLVKEDFMGPTSVDLNSMVIFKERFWVGGSYRTAVKLWDKEYAKESSVSSVNSFSGVLQFYLNKGLRIGYSYDYTLNQLQSMQNGSHEVTLGLTFPKKAARMLTPRFF